MDFRIMLDYNESLHRVDAWFHQAVVDRPPVRFSRHNQAYDSADTDQSRWSSLRDRWFDAEYQVDCFLQRIKGRVFKGETFPVYWPNLGPEIYAAFFGIELEFGEVTSWAKPVIEDIEDAGQFNIPQFDPDNTYYKQLMKMTQVALEKCEGKAFVGVSSWSPGIDCVAGWREPQELCVDLLTAPDEVHKLLKRQQTPMHRILDPFYEAIESRGHPSVGWMGIPARCRSHISQTDFANMISPDQFRTFCLPYLRQEISGFEYNIFHMDGKGVANHVDSLIEEPRINAIQWAQGVGADAPILQWIPLIKKIQSAGKSVVVDLKPSELDEFMSRMNPEGIFLWVAADDRDQDDIIRSVGRWTSSTRSK
jgi:hypothetical protein